MSQATDHGETDSQNEAISGKTPPKGRPTPSRREAQAAKARPLVPGKMDKDARKAARLAEREQREKARVGAMMGDERYLPVRDRGAQRKYVRDFVDARINFGEWMIPLMVIVLLLTLIPNDSLQLIFLSVIWVYVAVSVFDAWLCGRKARKLVITKFGEEKLQSGTRMYAAMRSLQMRMLRMPKPQVKRGAKVI